MSTRGWFFAILLGLLVALPWWVGVASIVGGLIR